MMKNSMNFYFSIITIRFLQLRKIALVKLKTSQAMDGTLHPFSFYEITT